jgi:hypothetical protein
LALTDRYAIDGVPADMNKDSENVQVAARFTTPVEQAGMGMTLMLKFSQLDAFTWSRGRPMVVSMMMA